MQKCSLVSYVLAAFFVFALLAGCAPHGTGGNAKTLTLSPSSTTLSVGETYQLRVFVSDEDETLEWESDDELVATVDDEGKVTACSAGIAVITVSCSFAEKSCTITVLSDDPVPPPAPTLTISSSALTLQVGKTATLTAAASDNSDVLWSTENAEVATVEEGTVTAAGVGKTRIVAESATAGRAYCTVTVEAPPVTIPEIHVAPAAISLAEGSEQQLTATTTDGSSVTWSSASIRVARVDQTGKVTAVMAGSTRITATSATAGSAYCEVTVTARQTGGYSLVWSDEFNSNVLDEANWEYQEGTHDVYHGIPSRNENWGNDELQYYTRDAVKVESGSLVITASRQSRGGMEFTSARITTRDRHVFTYGYFEARMRLPLGTGMWPAFWMLPQPANEFSTQNKYGGWPASGEIDIMEAKGRLTDRTSSALHFGPNTAGGWDSRCISKETALSTPISEWHTYGVEWTEDKIVYYVDRAATLTVTSSQWFSRNAEDNARAPFDVDFYLLFNLAVGGNFDGGLRPDASFTSASMYIDYVRVYQIGNA